MNRRHFLLLCLIAAAWLGVASDAKAADEDAIKQDKVKFLYPLRVFVKSSQDKKEETMIIGVLGKDPFDGENRNGIKVNHLDVEARESNADRANNYRRRIVIQRFATADKYQRCHLLFVSTESATNAATDTAEARLAAALTIAEREKDTAPVLVVSDATGFAKRGAPLNFYEVTGGNGSISVRYEFNPEAARRLGFDKINAQFYERIRLGNGRIVQ